VWVSSTCNQPTHIHLAARLVSNPDAEFVVDRTLALRLTQVVLVVFLAIPALWANRRRKKLDFFIEYGLDQTPKHLRTWVHLTLFASIVLFGPVIIAMPVVFIFNASQPSEPTLEEKKAIEVAEIRAIMTRALNQASDDAILGNCALVAKPGGSSVWTRSGLSRSFSNEVLSRSEVLDVMVETLLKYCGLRN
jgi:hypothetical protein